MSQRVGHRVLRSSLCPQLHAQPSHAHAHAPAPVESQQSASCCGLKTLCMLLPGCVYKPMYGVSFARCPSNVHPWGMTFSCLGVASASTPEFISVRPWRSWARRLAVRRCVVEGSSIGLNVLQRARRQLGLAAGLPCLAALAPVNVHLTPETSPPSKASAALVEAGAGAAWRQVHMEGT